MKRYLADIVKEDLRKKMVFVGGPRQVGKTTLSLDLLSEKLRVPVSEEHDAYLNWDDVEDRAALLGGRLPANQELILLDEIHRYPGWRNLVKGFYDKNRSRKSFLVTGSARLDFYRRGGDSLQGRYHYHRLHPLSLYELRSFDKGTFEQLLQLGGFPEPFFSGTKRDWKRWQRERLVRVFREDLVSLENVTEVGKLEHLSELLRARVGSILSLNALRGELACAHDTIERWVKILENLYHCFRIAPYGPDRVKAVKKEKKLYFWDWSLAADTGSQFENMVASNLLKYCHFQEDTEGEEHELRFLRDREKREVDFVVLKAGSPLFAVEVKSGETDLSPHIPYFSKRVDIPSFFQVHRKSRDVEWAEHRARSLPFSSFVKEILQV